MIMIFLNNFSKCAYGPLLGHNCLYIVLSNETDQVLCEKYLYN
jgi:hypothetical protein